MTYGITEQVFKDQESREIREGRFCKKCGARLEYEYYHYSQLGIYRCPSCGFKRPKIDYDASEISMENGLSFQVEGRKFTANYRGFYNIYNILAAYAGAREAGFALSRFPQVLNQL